MQAKPPRKPLAHDSHFSGKISRAYLCEGSLYSEIVRILSGYLN